MHFYRSQNPIPLLALCLFSLLGCGEEPPKGPEIEPVTGTVFLDNKPLANADLTFRPGAETAGIGGRARSDNEGRFEVQYGRGGEGLPPGKYQVAVSVRVMPDGSPAPPDENVDPIESQARETLPEKYSNIEKSQLEVTVETGKPIELKLSK